MIYIYREREKKKKTVKLDSSDSRFAFEGNGGFDKTRRNNKRLEKNYVNNESKNNKIVNIYIYIYLHVA